jgi:hypothetical protein
MIEPDPGCPHCLGSGLTKCKGLDIGLYPCTCCLEANNCDRCSTLLYGETRAPAARWNQGTGVLCVPCRREVYPPVIEIFHTSENGESIVIRGSPEGLDRLRNALKQAMQGLPTQVPVHGPEGEDLTLIVHLR